MCGYSNTPPTAFAGVDRTITLPTSSSAASNATANDSDGSIVSMVWTFVSGPTTPTITGGSTLTPTFSNMTVAGTYVFKFQVTDNDGALASDTMQVTVGVGPNQCAWPNSWNGNLVTWNVGTQAQVGVATACDYRFCCEGAGTQPANGLSVCGSNFSDCP